MGSESFAASDIAQGYLQEIEPKATMYSHSTYLGHLSFNYIPDIRISFASQLRKRATDFARIVPIVL